MDPDVSRERVREAGVTAWRAVVLAVAVLLVLAIYAGMAFLVYRGEMTEGPLILFSGVVLGYVLRLVHGVI
jgi:anti-sigma-K factor RskA